MIGAHPPSLPSGPLLDLLARLYPGGWIRGRAFSTHDGERLVELAKLGYVQIRPLLRGNGRGLRTYSPPVDLSDYGPKQVCITGIGDAEVEHARADGRLPDDTTNQNPIATPPLSDGCAVAVVL